MNMKPESDNFSLPKILVDVLFEEIVIALRKTQVRLTAEQNSCSSYRWVIVFACECLDRLT